MAPPQFQEKQPPPFPRPANPCLQSPSRRGYTARRCSEGESALVVGEGRAPSPWGPRKMVSLRRHGGSGGRRTGLSLHKPPDGAPGVPVRHIRGQEMVDASASSAGMDTVRKETPSIRFAMEREADAKTERPMPETGEQHPHFLSSQRHPSRGHKPPKGAPKGVTSNNQSRQLPAPRPIGATNPGVRHAGRIRTAGSDEPAPLFPGKPAMHCSIGMRAVHANLPLREST